MTGQVYFRLDVDDLPRKDAKSWAQETASSEYGKVTIMALESAIYYVAIEKLRTAEMFEEWLNGKEVRFQRSTELPLEHRASSSASGTSRSSSASSRDSGGGFWDGLFEGIGDFIGDLFD